MAHSVAVRRALVPLGSADLPPAALVVQIYAKLLKYYFGRAE
jgi:hypothetical protein